MFGTEKFEYDCINSPDALFEFVMDSVDACGIKLISNAMLDIYVDDIHIVADAINSGSKQYLGLAIERLFHFVNLKGGHDEWNRFADRCLRKQADLTGGNDDEDNELDPDLTAEIYADDP